MALITDVSRRIAVEQQLREAQKLEAVGQLAGGIANDFSDLLTVIQSLTKDSLTLIPPDGPLRPNLEAIQAASNRAVHLTQQLLTFANQKTSQPQELVWAEAIANVEVLLGRVLPDRIGIVFKTHTGAAK